MTTYLPQHIISIKSQGHELSDEMIRDFIEGIVADRITDAQIAAFCMAVLIRGMTLQERTDMTLAMAAQGHRYNWLRHNLDGPVLDKHSTGGVGDKTSLILVPVLAVCGAFAPMISARGLGHTGGTVDKLESIPGYNALPDVTVMERIVREVGCVIAGASDQLSPADRRIFAVRDVTATVASLDLITASILSKKLASDLDGLVLDVKYGSGAFIQEPAAAMELAQSMVDVANNAGMHTRAILTDMNSVLGRHAGNWLEIEEVLNVLTKGTGDERLLMVCRSLAAEALELAGLASTVEEGALMFTKALESGQAAERFGQMVAGLGGPRDLLEKYQDENYQGKAKRAPVVMDVLASQSGYVGEIDVNALGWAIVKMGGGRINPADTIDPRVGLTGVLHRGEPVTANKSVLAQVHAANKSDAKETIEAIKKAMTIVPDAPSQLALVKSRVIP